MNTKCMAVAILSLDTMNDALKNNALRLYCVTPVRARIICLVMHFYSFDCEINVIKVVAIQVVFICKY
jgi:hypothetical protein